MTKIISALKKIPTTAKVVIAAAAIAVPVITSYVVKDTHFLDYDNRTHQIEISPRDRIEALSGKWTEIREGTTQLSFTHGTLTEIKRRGSRNMGNIHHISGNLYAARNENGREKHIQQASPDIIFYGWDAFIKNTVQREQIQSLEEIAIAGKWVATGIDITKKKDGESQEAYESRVGRLDRNKTYLGPKYQEITNNHVYCSDQANIRENELPIRDKFKVGDSTIIMMGSNNRPLVITPNETGVQILSGRCYGNYKRP